MTQFFCLSYVLQFAKLLVLWLPNRGWSVHKRVFIIMKQYYFYGFATLYSFALSPFFIQAGCQFLKNESWAWASLTPTLHDSRLFISLETAYWRPCRLEPIASLYKQTWDLLQNQPVQQKTSYHWLWTTGDHHLSNLFWVCLSMVPESAFYSFVARLYGCRVTPGPWRPIWTSSPACGVWIFVRFNRLHTLC